MTAVPRAADEDGRLAALHHYRVLDTAPEPALDELTELAASICGAPISLIALVDETRQWFKSRIGLEAAQTPRNVAFCAHVLDRTSPLIVPDATLDARFAHYPLVTGEPGIRFYAGAPLTTPAGHVLGALCVMDRVPRQLTDGQVRALSALSRQVMAQLELHRQSEELRERETRLEESEERFSKVFYSSPAALMLLRLRDGAIVDVNGAFERVTGRLRSASLGRTVAELGIVTEDARALFRREISSAGAISTNSFRFRHSGGDERFGIGTAELVPLRGEPHVVATLLDVTELRQAEASLRESEERLRLALDAAGMGTFDWDMVSGRITWSRRHEEIWGLQPGTFDGTYRAFARGVHPSDLAGVNDVIRRCIAARESFDCEFRVVRPDGTVRWVTGRGEFVFDETGTPVRMRGVVQDMTARKAAHAEARANEARFTLRIQKLNRVYLMLGQINEAIVRETDPAAMLAAACRITVETGGFRMAWIGLLGDSGLLDLRAHAGADAGALAIVNGLIRDEPPAGCAMTAGALRTGRPAICDAIATDPRTVAWRERALARAYQSMAALPLSSGDRTIGVFNIYADEVGVFDPQEVQLLNDVATDISFALGLLHRDAEQRQAEERFRLVVENIQEVFWIIDPWTKQTLYVSPAYETIWGRTCESLLDSTPGLWLETVHADDRPRVAEAVRTRVVTGVYDETYRIIRPDGAVRWIRARGFPVRNEAGTLTRMVGTAADITEQRHLEEQFRQAQKMESVGRLAGGIAHDFNNLLTVINSTAELAMTGLPPDASLRNDLIQIRQSGDRAATLTRQLLSLSRQQILKPAVINLTAVLRGMQSMLRRLIGEDISMVFTLRDRVGNVKADPSQIEQVVLNLAVNAQDAMPRGGRLTIETADVTLDVPDKATHLAAKPGPYVMIAVSDTGIGMDEATRQRIFEPFFTTKDLGKGTGLGLSTVYGIVEQSGGGLHVSSEPRRGTTFRVYLPRVDDAPARPVPTEQIDRRGDETILLVEDEDALRRLTRRILEAVGYTVLEAATGDDALAVLTGYRGRVHLMLTDVVMPGMNGRDLAARVAELRPDVRTLYASGYTDDTIFRHGVHDDGSRFISKPYAPAELRRKVREVLDRA